MLKLYVENLKTLDGGRMDGRKFENLGRWKDGWMGGRKGGWMEATAGLRIAYSNQQKSLVTEWMSG